MTENMRAYAQAKKGVNMTEHMRAYLAKGNSHFSVSECVERKLDTQGIFLPRVFHAPFVLCNREAKVVERKRQGSHRISPEGVRT